MNAINCYLPTEAQVEFNVYGGTNGGTYAFSIVNGDKLRHVGGDRLCEGAVGGGQSIMIRARYEAVSASGSTNDIVAKAEFTEAETHRHLADMHSELTAVSKTIETGEDWNLLSSRQYQCPLQACYGGLQVCGIVRLLRLVRLDLAETQNGL